MHDLIIGPLAQLRTWRTMYFRTYSQNHIVVRDELYSVTSAFSTA